MSRIKAYLHNASFLPAAYYTIEVIIILNSLLDFTKQLVLNNFKVIENYNYINCIIYNGQETYILLGPKFLTFFSTPYVFLFY